MTARSSKVGFMYTGLVFNSFVKFNTSVSSDGYCSSLSLRFKDTIDESNSWDVSLGTLLDGVLFLRTATIEKFWSDLLCLCEKHSFFYSHQDDVFWFYPDNFFDSLRGDDNFLPVKYELFIVDVSVLLSNLSAEHNLFVGSCPPDMIV